MSRKRDPSPKSTRPQRAPAPSPSAAEPAPDGAWPAEFGTPRRAAVAAAATAAVALALALAVAFGDLLWAKRLIAWGIGLANPFDINGQSADLAMILGGFAAIAGGAAVHPVLGLAVLLLARPWLDGYTYPTDNTYFLWATMLLAGVWGLRAFLHGAPRRAGAPLALLAAYMAWMLIASTASVQWEHTYRQWLYWFMYAGIFLLATNAADTPRARGLLLTALVASTAFQCLFAILHFEYLLPFMRRLVQNPDMLERFFGIREMTPELARRFQINRAFGSLLFPNALAAFIVLGLPYALLGGVRAWQRFLPAWRARTRSSAPAARPAMLLASAAWFVAMSVMLAALTFIAGYDESPMSAGGIVAISFAFGFAAAAPAFLVARDYGPALCGAAARALLLPPTAATMLYALWITYSRGGLIAFAAAMALAAVLVYHSPARWQALRARLRFPSAAAAAALLAACAALFAIAGAALAQTEAAPSAAPASPPAAVVTERGQDVGSELLLDPASFRVRLTYWRVGLDMFLHHWGLGVGPGNFKTAYPNYQYLGAGNVKEAHNGYLQLLCESGLAGGLLFTAFCAWTVLAGARRVLALGTAAERLVPAGLLAGLVAFLLHSAIDIDFSHPTLMVFFMAYAGVFCNAMRPDPAASAPPWPRAAGLAAVTLAALCAGMGTRTYLQDLALSRVSAINVAGREDLNERLNTLTVLQRGMMRWAGNQQERPPSLPVASVAKLVPDLGRIRAMGDIFAPAPGSGFRPIGRTEPVPPGSVILLNKIAPTLRAAQEFMQGHAAELERIDARFPHTLELAIYLTNWYRLGYEFAWGKPMGEFRRRAVERTAYWAQETVRRSPMLADAYEAAATALWVAARWQTGGEQKRNYRLALDWLERATELNDTAGDYNVTYSIYLRAMADANTAEGKAAEAAEFQRMADRQHALGFERLNARWQRGL